MILNPELRRNAWLELSLQKLIITPLVIGAILWLCYLTEKHSIDEAAYNIALFYLFLWGTKCASESISNELQHHTWDYQRLSTMTPWTLSWGKLLGSTLYAWYGALISLTAYTCIIASSQAPYIVVGKIIILVLGGLLAQSAAFLLSMTGLQSQNPPKVNTGVYLIFGLFITWPTYYALDFIAHSHVRNHDLYGIALSQFDFYFGSLCVFLFWSLMGIYRSMRNALQYPSVPWVWFLFMMFCIFYTLALFKMDLKSMTISNQSGNIHNVRFLTSRYFTFFLSIFLTYIAVFLEKIDVVTYKKLVYKKRKPLYLPRWIISLIVTMGVGIWMGFLPALSLEQASHDKWVLIHGIFIASCILFLIRDILIIHYFKFSTSTTRSATTSLFYLSILYILIPALLRVTQVPNEFLNFFLPNTVHYEALSLAAPALEIGLMVWLIKKKVTAHEHQAISTNSI